MAEMRNRDLWLSLGGKRLAGSLYPLTSARVFTVVLSANTTLRNTERRTVNYPFSDRCS